MELPIYCAGQRCTALARWRLEGRGPEHRRTLACDSHLGQQERWAGGDGGRVDITSVKQPGAAVAAVEDDGQGSLFEMGEVA